ncbi:hypothetical protein FOXYSP1_20618 [Fusarium oxysporum f. sp. phaseoli]
MPAHPTPRLSKRPRRVRSALCQGPRSMVPISKRRLYLDGGTGSKPNHRRQEACGITSSSRGLTRRTATVPGKRRRGHFPEELDRRKTGCQGKRTSSCPARALQGSDRCIPYCSFPNTYYQS